MREKKFLDTVHGYISIPEEYCEKLIDTENFQRLRRIEQTSARSLFPCARHDRFVHSLGVYHIGRKMIASLSQIVKEHDSLINSFQIACLLHDCGHSPFSHTLEHFYGKERDLYANFLQALKEKGNAEEFSHIDISEFDTKQHEIISALLCVKVYYDAIKSLNGDPCLVARMIMGIPYGTADKSLDDCFISLLHGDVIDADKLDYICRDKWASGYLANSVDLDRLIAGIEIYEKDAEGYRIAYSKNCINEIKALIECKNFETNWVFKHHLVVYEQKLFIDSVEDLVKSLGSPGMISATAIFDYNAFLKKIQVVEGVETYMTTDDDIIYLMKSHHDSIPHLDEWLSRKYKHFALWKSHSELIAKLGASNADKMLRDSGKIYDDVCKHINDNFSCDAFALEATPKITRIHKDEITISFGNGVYVDYCSLSIPTTPNVYMKQTFKYIYVKRDSRGSTQEILRAIQTYLSSYPAYPHPTA